MPVRGSAAALFVFGFLAAAPDHAQTPAPAPVSASAPNAPEIAARDAPATFSTKVNLVMVPVVVRDSKGKAIGTLQKDDFQLSDKGKPQTITRFSIEKAGDSATPAEVAGDAANVDKAEASSQPAAPIAQRFVMFLFDDVHLGNSDIIQARNAAAKYLSESLDPITRVGIFTTSGQGNLDFTDDRVKLQEALMKLTSRPTLAASDGTECPDLTYYMADRIYNKNDQTLLQTEAQEVLATCDPPPPIPPGTPPQVAQAMLQQAEQSAERVIQATASRIVSMGERDTRLAFTVLENAIRRLSAAPGERSLILVSPGFLITDELRNEESGIMDRAIRANVRINALNARGLYTLIPGGDASTPNSVASPQILNAKAKYQQESAIEDEGIMEELASATGGRYFHNNNDLKAGFGQLAATPEFVYVLGFSPQNLKLDGSYHTLKVTLKNSNGLNLQARRGYYAPKHLADPEEDAKREIEEAMFSRDELHDIPIDLHMQFFKTSDVAAKIAVLARIDVKNLRFRKADARNNDNIVILSGLFDRNGNYVTGVQKTLQLHLLDTTLEKLLNAGITVRTNFDVAPGSYVVRLVVRDSEGQTMAARNGVVEIPY